MMQKLMIRLATFFGVGKLPKAPGTWGTLAALPLVFVMAQLGPIYYMIGTFLLLMVAIFSAEIYEKHSQSHDAKEVVIDEVLGILITMTWLPITWQSFVFGFILFRVLDIWKPFPIGFLDKRIQGGLGVVIDDVAAGIIANILLQLIYAKTAWLGVQSVVISG